MKKILAFIMVAVMILGLVACDSSTTPDNLEGEKTTIRLYASAPGGQWYPMGTAFITQWEKRIPNALTNLSPGSGGENVKTLFAGDAEVAFTQAYSIRMAAVGQSPYSEVYDGIVQLSALHPACVQIVVRANSEIKSMEDMLGKNIGLGNVGEIQNTAFLSILEEEYGISEDDIIKAGGTINYFGDAEAPKALADGQMDCIVVLGSYPRAALGELELNPGMRLISIEEDKMANFISKNSAWNTTVIPAGTYKNQNEDVTVITTWAVLGVREDMDEQLAYELTAAIWDNLDELKATSRDIDLWMSLDTATAAVSSVPLHPGATRYFKEVGILK